MTWTPVGCGADPLTALGPRAAIDLVGDATFPVAYVGQDATYLFFRYRVNGDPSGTRGFDGGSAWAMLVQVPGGSPFQYQYELALNGEGQGGDGIEVWANTAPQDLDFTPLFTDDAETRLFRQVHDFADATTVNTTPLARLLPTTDGSNFNGNKDYFIDVAFPISALIGAGVIGSAADLADVLLWPTTSTVPNRHNRDYLNCPFLSATELVVGATVTPSTVGANTTTPVRYSITVRDAGTAAAKGVVIAHPALAPYLSNVRVSASADDPGVSWTVVSENPLEVRVPALPAGATLTVRIDADAAPGCLDLGATGSATAFATNAFERSAPTVLALGGEVCDGADNDCDGSIDEGAAALCDDANACNGVETCGGTSGCQPGTAPDCNDHEECTTDGCDAASGCFHTPISECASCQNPSDCLPGDGCSTVSCPAGLCVYTPIPDCTRCTTAAECRDDDPCTDDVCNALGVCENPPHAGCVRCTQPAECDDGDPCTSDQCGADGTCARTTIPGCQRCTAAAECNDRNQCTDDGCLGGVCAHAPISGCSACVPQPEGCADGADDDCDGLTDCNDPDCADSPACPTPTAEICGNCADDDGDGRVDGEDPDCCVQPMSLGVEHFTLRAPAGKARGNGLRLATQYAPVTPPLFDPLRQDTAIQLSDGSGALFCATVPADRWRRTRRLTFRFTDRADAFAGGLDSGEFRITRNGILRFTTRGRGMSLRPVDGGSVRLTVRVGSECSQSSMALRPARKGLVFP